jgi:hypothetical protein
LNGSTSTWSRRIQLALALVDQLDALCGCRLAVRHVDNLEAIDIETMLASDGALTSRRLIDHRNLRPGIGK